MSVHNDFHIYATGSREVAMAVTRTQSGNRRLGSVTLARSRVRVRAGYVFVSCRHHPRSKRGFPLHSGIQKVSVWSRCTYSHGASYAGMLGGPMGLQF